MYYSVFEKLIKVVKLLLISLLMREKQATKYVLKDNPALLIFLLFIEGITH